MKNSISYFSIKKEGIFSECNKIVNIFISFKIYFHCFEFKYQYNVSVFKIYFKADVLNKLKKYIYIEFYSMKNSIYSMKDEIIQNIVFRIFHGWHNLATDGTSNIKINRVTIPVVKKHSVTDLSIW